MTKQIKLNITLSLTCCLLFISSYTFCQRDVSEAIATPYIGIHYGANLPGGELAERYGFINSVGTHIGYKTKKNWIFGIEGNLLFGNNVKIEGVLQNLIDDHQQIINSSGAPASVGTFFRGFNVNAVFSKVIPVWGPNPNSGIIVQLGGGYLWHKMKIDALDDEVPQVQGEYTKGYDRLTIGVNTTQFIGYNYMANRGIVNFYAGFYFMQGFTKNQRDVFWDHPNEQASKKIRIEHLFGIKVGWLVPIYKRQAKDFYFN